MVASLMAMLNLASAQGDDHHHAEPEPCACAATEAIHPFSLDCADSAAITASATLLASCSNDESGCEDYTDANGVMTCQGAFFHITWAHFWCGEDSLTTAQDELLHTYEAACATCVVGALYDPLIADCTQPTCTDAAPALAAFNILNAACVADGGDGTCCTTPEEVGAWQTVLAYHDLCDHDDVPMFVEMAKHEFGHACEDSMCNTSPPDYDGTVCAAAHDDHDEPFTCRLDTNEDGLVGVDDLLAMLAGYGADTSGCSHTHGR